MPLNSAMFWNVRAMPCAAAVVRVHVAARFAAKRDRALLRPVDAVDDVQHRALARAVGADDRAHLVLAHVERDVGQRLDAAERERDVRRARGSRRRSAAPSALTRLTRRAALPRRAKRASLRRSQVGSDHAACGRPRTCTSVSMCCDGLAGVERIDQHARISRRRSRGAPCACASARRRRGRAPCAGSGSGGPASRRARASRASSAFTCSTHSRISS